MKTFTLRALLLLTLITLSILSCTKEEKEQPKVLTLSATSMEITAGTNATINVTSNVAWTASATDGYTISPSSGNGNGVITVKAALSATNGTVTITGGGITAKVTITSPAATADITLSKSNITLTYQDNKSESVNLSCNGSWQVVLPISKPDWLKSVTPMNGIGDGSITIATSEHTIRSNAQTIITIKSGSYSKNLIVNKSAAPNFAPTKPTNIKPQGNGAELFPLITWNASTDKNGDKLTYTVQLSKNKTTWTSFPKTDKTELLINTPLDINTTYYLKVIADDGLAAGKTESDIVSFRTQATKTYWEDGEVKQYNVNPDGSVTEVPLGSTPRKIKIFYLGDGYTQVLYKYGGQFEREIKDAIKALFVIEPYKSFTHYFTVYVVAAYSNEEGMSIGSDWTTPTTAVDTKFKSTWAGGSSTSIKANDNLIMEYAAKAPGYKGATWDITKTNLTYSPISLIINSNVYAGTCSITSHSGGYNVLSVAKTPARHPKSSSYGDSWNTLRHEFGGHGFGLLADEYVNSSNKTTHFPIANYSNYKAWLDWACYGMNVYVPEYDSVHSIWKPASMSDTPSYKGANWKSFADLGSYSGAKIALYEGARYYGLGAYRSEQGSCMINNIPHFNTISRWRIYCRIKETAGETPTIADFMAKDKDIVNIYSSAPTKSQDFRPLAPPELIGFPPMTK